MGDVYKRPVLEQNISLKTAEIKALQSQLNPHFIFNVLNTLAWKAEMSDNSELSQMAIEMCIRDRNIPVPYKQKLSHMVQIQRLSYSNSNLSVPYK